MIPVDSCSVIPLHANYYLFGVYFPGKTGEDGYWKLQSI